MVRQFLGAVAVAMVCAGSCGCCQTGPLASRGSLWQPSAPMAGIAPPNSYSYGQPDRVYPQNGMPVDAAVAPALGRATAPPGRFYDPRNALVANDLGSQGAPVYPGEDRYGPAQSAWGRGDSYASMVSSSRQVAPSNGALSQTANGRGTGSDLEAIGGMRINDGTRNYSSLDLNGGRGAPRSDLADRYGTRRGYGGSVYSANSSTTGGYHQGNLIHGDTVSRDPTYNGNYTLRGMRGTQPSTEFSLGNREEDAERR